MNIMVIILTIIAFGAGIMGYIWEKGPSDDTKDDKTESNNE